MRECGNGVRRAFKKHERMETELYFNRILLRRIGACGIGLQCYSRARIKKNKNTV